MARIIVDSYKEGNKSVISNVRGFVEAREVFQLIKQEMGEWEAIDFYDQLDDSWRLEYRFSWLALLAFPCFSGRGKRKKKKMKIKCVFYSP